MKELYDDIGKATGFINEAYKEDQNNKQQLTNLWERCAAFANGNQSDSPTTTSTFTTTATNMFVSNQQDTRMRAYTTNEIEPIIRTLVSYATKSQPTLDIYSNESTEEGEQKAELADKIMQAKYVLDKEIHNSKLAAHYAFTFGSVFRKDYWDLSKGADFEMPSYDELGNEIIDPNTGQVQTQSSKTGDNAVAILTPFSMSFDWSYTDFETLPYIFESYLMPVEWVKDNYDQNAPGYTGKALSVGEGADLGNSLTVLERLKYASPFTLGTAVKINTAGKALIQECYIQPNGAFPKGRLIILANSICVYDSANNGQDLGSPYWMPYEKAMWHPYTMFRNDLYVGRLLGKGIVESILAIQIRLNEINGAILQNANTLAKVDILSPENCLKKGVLNGAGAQIYTYKETPSGARPEKWAGTPLPAQFFNERETLIESMVRIAGTNFVMSGNPPKGVTAAAAIESLLENATSQRSDFSLSWETFHQEAFTKKLRIIRNFNKFPNKEVVDYIKSIAKDALDSTVEEFTGEDIGDGIALKIEAGSSIPKSEKARRETYKQLAKDGLLGPIPEDSPRGAKLRKELLRVLGEEPFDIDENADVEKAYWENDRMLKLKPAEVWEEDNHAIHLSCHISKMKDPKFLERASDQVKMAFQGHVDQHKQIIQMQQMQQMQAQMAAQAGPVPQGAIAPPQAPPPPPNLNGEPLQ